MSETNMTTVEVLKRARAMIEDPAHWWQSGGGRSCPEGSTCAWLAVAAVRDVRSDESWQAVERVKRLMCSVLGAPKATLAPIFDFNDTHTHAEVLALFDKAIALCTRKE